MFLEQMTGAKLPIVSDQQPQGPKEIILGDNAHLRKLGVAIDFAALGKEGYVIRTVGDHLVIAGGAVAGEHVRRVRVLGGPLGLPLVRPGREPHSEVRAAGDRPDRRPPGARARIPRAVRLRVLRRRLVRPKPHELEQRPAGREARRQGDVRRRVLRPHVRNRLVPPEKYFDKHPGVFLAGQGQAAEGVLRSFAAPIPT